jgi:hypothetical protein
MSMQTDVKTSQEVTPQYVTPAGLYPLNTPEGSPIQSCRIKAIILRLPTYDDGLSYGGIVEFGSAKADGSGYKAVFSTSLGTPLYSPAPTLTWLMPGEGILVKDNLWWYSDNSNYIPFYVIYG